MQDADKGAAPALNGQDLRIGIVQARFNAEITARLAESCLAELRALGVSERHIRAAADSFERHGLAGQPIDRYDSGSLPVYAVGPAHVLKLFPPEEAAHAQTEARALAAVQGALP